MSDMKTKQTHITPFLNMSCLEWTTFCLLPSICWDFWGKEGIRRGIEELLREP